MTALAWIRRSFFATWIDAILSILAILLLARILPGLFAWLVTDSQVRPASLETCVRSGGACWAFLQDKWRLILFGTFPYDAQWRPALALGVFAAMVILSAVPALWDRPRRRWMMVGLWLAGLASVAALMSGGVLGLDPVGSRLWAGLPLTVMLAAFGMVLGFGLAIPLALGRRSDMFVIRWLSTAYIEFFRGVPLISLLFLANFLFPLVVPPGVTVDSLLRAQLAFGMFFAAYMAEALRGGLQAVPPGQYAAAGALGMGYWQAHIRIILPQALRLVIPSMVNIFIAAFKDTSLVVVISMLDLLGAANASKADAKWWGIYIEAYLFIAVIYLVVCGAMSAWSRRLERRLGTSSAHD